MLRVKARTFKTKTGTGKTYYIRGICPYTGERINESAHTNSRSHADFKLTQYLANAREEAALGAGNGTAYFAEAVEEYIGKGGEARFISPLLEAFGTKRLRDIEDQDLTRLGRKVYRTAKASTLVRQLYGPVQAVWNAAVAAKMAPPRLFAKPKVKTTQAVAVDDDWLLTLLRDGLTNLRQKTAVLFMSFSGSRATETVEVRVKHYDPDTARVLIADTKNDEHREVLLPPFIHQAMRLLDRSDPEARLFGYASRWSLTQILKRGCARAGIPYYSPHKVGRHTFAKRFLADGNSLKALQEAGGWKTIGVVAKTYGHLERAQVQQQVAGVTTKLGQYACNEAGSEIEQRAIELKPLKNTGAKA